MSLPETSVLCPAPTFHPALTLPAAWRKPFASTCNNWTFLQVSHFGDHFSSLLHDQLFVFTQITAQAKVSLSHESWKKNLLIFIQFFFFLGGGRAVEIWKDSLRNSHRSCFPLDLRATYRMVVCGETAGTVSRFRCIHLTVVRKHRQRLGQPAAGRGPLVSANKASGRSRHGEKSWPAPSAIAC